MRRLRTLALLCTIAVAASVAGIACAKKEVPAPAAETGTTPPDAGKIPVTTASAEARSEFLKGRDLSEKLRITDSIDRKSTRLNSSHSQISYAVFCLKKKN